MTKLKDRVYAVMYRLDMDCVDEVKSLIKTEGSFFLQGLDSYGAVYDVFEGDQKRRVAIEWSDIPFDVDGCLELKER